MSSTMAQELWLLYMCSQDQRFSSDRREQLDPLGKKKFKYKELVVQQKKITARAFADGNSNVTLGISSMIRENKWDAVLAEPNDIKWYANNDEEISLQ
eukprot:5986878-Ditylum_brightwellii.AAC.1